MKHQQTHTHIYTLDVCDDGHHIHSTIRLHSKKFEEKYCFKNCLYG